MVALVAHIIVGAMEHAARRRRPRDVRARPVYPERGGRIEMIGR